MRKRLTPLLYEVRACELCKSELEPRPVLQVSRKAKVLIAGQAPGSKVHASGVPFDDASGDRLRDWMGISRDTFYDASKIAILPMAFCYPGKGKSGDLPPPPRCAETWRDVILRELISIELTLIIGQYAIAWHMSLPKSQTLTDTVKSWRDLDSGLIPLPHPSPRNNIWLKKNSWFEIELIPKLKARVSNLLKN
jgi:uracil-DNA glycosylase